MRGRTLAFVVAISGTPVALATSGCDAKLVVLSSTSRATNGGSSAGGARGGGGSVMSFGGSAGMSLSGGGETFACTGYDCTQINCPSGSTTSVSGTVYDPAGKVPLYNVVVYVPYEPPGSIAPGRECRTCETPITGRPPVAATLSRSDGRFVLEDVPPGNDIPIVIQIGKWRRQLTIPHVAACSDNPIGRKDASGDEMLTRLPRNRSEGDIPQIGVVTGHSDALECLLRKIGVDDAEFTTDAGGGSVHMYVGCPNPDSTPIANHSGANRFAAELGGAGFPVATSLYADRTKLARYDILLMSCEGTQCTNDKSPYVGDIKDYADQGGRLFLDHTHYYWLRKDPVWRTTADYAGANASDLPDPFTLTKIDTQFPKGNAFADWLVTVGASPVRGHVTIYGGQFTFRDAYPPRAQRWIYTDQNPSDPSGHAVEYMTMNTPVEYAPGAGGAAGATGAAGASGAAGAAGTGPGNAGSGDAGPGDTLPPQCGRVVYTDLHVVSVANDSSDQDTPFPHGCTAPKPALTAQEKALEFMFFDLSSCVQPERNIPTPPITVIK